MQQYEKYKDSGVAWIGKIPKQWNILKLKFLFKDVSIKNRPDLDLLSVTQDQGVVPRSMVENRMVMPTGNLESFKVISKGDFAISLRSFEGGLEYSEYEGLISPAYTVLKSQKEINDNYFKFLFKSKAFIAELQLSIVGIREGKNISYEELKYSYTPIPPLIEQQAVATFLDDKTSKIDQTIVIKQKEIELLKERRQILIQKAVTKGLDDNVKMKDSGVDWIGEIPEHWDTVKLKFLGNAIIGLTYSPNDLCDPTEGKLVLRSSNLRNGKFVYGEKENVYVKGRISDKLLIRKDDILICSRNGSRDLIGKCAIANTYDIGHSFGAFNTVFRSKYNRYLFCILNSNIFKSLSGSFLTSTINQLTIGNLNSIKVPIPPETEMEQIRLYVEAIEEKITKAILLKQQEIDKLKEYKTVLIDNVVTGKVRVS
ncbi:putative type I restriction-modification system [Chryseobacterium sp. StRB126]|uniref:restriction endonuclease subunit S n=1 Tax=Chryseobacterium sp. StRB126 TaxID=878220 RepID=UPI0004E9898F|nr:restriction endonuclease subunit S [Chryseobacterium sp. StRB126]BAP32670.1 putative type I restriction-modification system [Chryseobacterium sp. StRB126]